MAATTGRTRTKRTNATKATKATPRAKQAALDIPTRAPATSKTIDVRVIPRDKLTIEDGFNPRNAMDEADLAGLAESIRARGVLQALTVAAQPDGTFKLLGGHRRVAAGDRVGLTDYPAVIRESDNDAQLVDAVVDNKERVDLNPVEEAEAFGRLVHQHGLTPKGVAEACGVAPRLVTERLRILELPEPVRAYIANGQLGTSAVAGLAQIAAKLPETCSTIVEHAFKEADSWGEWHHDIDRQLLERKGGWYDALEHYAKTHPGIVYVYGGNTSGGGWWLRDSSHWAPRRGADIDPRDIPGALGKEAKDKINAMNSGADDYHRYKVALAQTDVDALDAAGVLIRDPDDTAGGVCHDMTVLAAICEPIIVKDHAAWAREKAKIAKRQAAGGKAKGDSAQEKSDQAAKDYAAAIAAHESNLRLGEQLTRHFGQVEFTMDSARLICHLFLEEVDIMALAERGLRYVLPQWQQEVTQRNGKQKLRVKGDGTKAPKDTDGGGAEGDIVAAFWEWWGLATTPQEVLGRTVIAAAASRFANQDAIPKSRHRMFGLGGESWYTTARGKGIDMLDALVKPKLPGEKKKPAAKAKPETEPPVEKVIVHVRPTGAKNNDDLQEAELLPDVNKRRPHTRKVIYTDSRTAAWVDEARITDLPDAPRGMVTIDGPNGSVSVVVNNDGSSRITTRKAATA